MNGKSSVEDARSALQALLQTSKGYPEPRVNGSVDGQPGAALRRLFRADIQKSLRPPAQASQLAAELESQVSRLLAHAPVAPVAEHVAEPTPPPPIVEKVVLADDKDDEDSDEDADEEDDEPFEDEQPQPRRKLFHEEQRAAGLREQVVIARRCLHELDDEVTKLTRKLREGRQTAWIQQQLHSAIEARIAKALAARAADLKQEAIKEMSNLEKEEQKLRQSLVEMRARASRWWQEAKHHDSILQQERDAQKGGEAHRLLARHPAGEVFLPSFPSDNDSDDDYYDGPPPPRRPPPTASTTVASSGGRKAAGDSSDEDSDGDDYQRPQGGGGAGPPPPLRRTEDSDSDREDSDAGSSLVSPAGESGSLSGMLEKSGEDHIPAKVPVRKPRSDSESSSDDEDPGPAWKNAAPTAAAASASASTPVPPLPAVERKPLRPDEDDASEISSEEIEAVDESMETSRSL